MKNLRIKFSKKGQMVYISHLDLMRLFQRSFRRSGIMLKHTEGFNPQPKMSFATALALGTASEGEYMDVELAQDIEVSEIKDRLNESLPKDIKIIKVAEKNSKESIMSLIEWGQYLLKVNANFDYREEEVIKEIETFLKLEEIIEIKQKKKKNKVTTREVNIRPNIKTMELIEAKNSEIILKLFLKTGSNGNLKPETVAEKLKEYTSLDIDLNSIRVERIDLFVERDDKIVTPI